LKTITRCAVLAVIVFSTTSAQALPFTFTKLPAGKQALAVSTAAQAVDAVVFQMSSTDLAAATVTRMSFLITGNLPIGSLFNLDLVYFPNGLAAPGVIVGTNDGSTWARSAKQALIEISLAAPLTVQQNTSHFFALRPSVKGASSFFFTSDVYVVTVSSDGVERRLIGETEDLPLPGDTFHVN
jgi:hypothetical protein